MSRLIPTAPERASLRFLIPMGGLPGRFLLSGALFLGGFSLACMSGGTWTMRLGLAVILAGHLPLWVRTQTIAPGSATPKHEDVWVPVEDAWLDRVLAHERRGERWDTTPWDISNVRGKVTLAALLVVLAGIPYVAGIALESGTLHGVAVAVPFLLVPLWLNGMRTVWNPSELRIKGGALAAARAAAEKTVKGRFDFVPMLALREGRRGKYPVDARLMLRPAKEEPEGFLGVQFQVSINSVQGTDYPYFYAVVLARGGCRLPKTPGRQVVGGVTLVYEAGEKEGVRFLVVRQHADKGGGWHTPPEIIGTIAGEALRLAGEVRAGGGAPA